MLRVLRSWISLQQFGPCKLSLLFSTSSSRTSPLAVGDNHHLADMVNSKFMPTQVLHSVESSPCDVLDILQARLVQYDWISYLQSQGRWSFTTLGFVYAKLISLRLLSSTFGQCEDIEFSFHVLRPTPLQSRKWRLRLRHKHIHHLMTF